MSEREKVHQIIDQIPDYKIGQLLVFLQGMKLDDEIEDDLFFDNLINEYLKNERPDKHETITLEEFAASEGVSL